MTDWPKVDPDRPYANHCDVKTLIHLMVEALNAHIHIARELDLEWAEHFGRRQ